MNKSCEFGMKCCARLGNQNELLYFGAPGATFEAIYIHEYGRAFSCRVCARFFCNYLFNIDKSVLATGGVHLLYPNKWVFRINVPSKPGQ